MEAGSSAAITGANAAFAPQAVYIFAAVMSGLFIFFIVQLANSYSVYSCYRRFDEIKKASMEYFGYGVVACVIIVLVGALGYPIYWLVQQMGEGNFAPIWFLYGLFALYCAVCLIGIPTKALVSRILAHEKKWNDLNKRLSSKKMKVAGR